MLHLVWKSSRQADKCGGDADMNTGALGASKPWIRSLEPQTGIWHAPKLVAGCPRDLARVLEDWVMLWIWGMS